MSTATFKVRANFDGAGGLRDGTIKIDRATGAITARAKKSRTAYETTLTQVANMICRIGIQRQKTEDAEEGGDD